MKKTLKIILLLSFTCFLTAVLALAVGAAPAGSTERLPKHTFSVNVNNTLYFYDDLEAAVADVPSGGTITLLCNATAGGKRIEGDHAITGTVENGYIAALSLSRDAAYTIDGNGYTLTLTPGYSLPCYAITTGGKATMEKSVALHITAGNPTFKNLTFKLAQNTTADVAVYIQNPKLTINTLHVTFEDVVLNFPHSYGLWAHQHANVTVKGDKTLIAGSTINALRMQGGAGASTFSLEGGIVIGSNYGIEIKGVNATFKMSGGTLGAPTPIKVTAKSTFKMSGGTIKVATNGIFNIDRGITFTTKLTGGTIAIQDGSHIPFHEGIDTSALDLLWRPDYITLTPRKIGSNTYYTRTFASQNDWRSFLNSVKPSVQSSAYKSVSYADLIPILIPKGMTLNITDGSYVTPTNDMAALFYVNGGTLNIKGGSFKNTNPSGALISVPAEDSTSIINVTGGVLHATKYVISVDNTSLPASISLNNATIVMGEHVKNLLDATAFALDSFSHTNLTVLGKAGTLIFDGIYIDEDSPLVLFAGKYYGVHFTSAPTDQTLDLSTNTKNLFEGASVYIAPTLDQSGIRFVTELSEEVIHAIKAKGGTPIFGTVIAPLDYVLKANAFTTQALSSLSVSGSKYEKIPAVKSIRDADEDGIPESYSAALINLKQKNYARSFAAIPYVEINGSIYYGAFNANGNARSIGEIAKQCLKIADYFNETEVAQLKAYAGFSKPDDFALSLTWTRGIVTSKNHSKPHQIISSLVYVYSNVIHIEKAGTTITFTDPNASIADDTTLVISHWIPSGDSYVLDTTAGNYTGTSEKISLTAYGETHYTYVSSRDNEYIRICVRQSPSSTVPVYSEYTNATGTDHQNTDYASPAIPFTINGLSVLKYQIVLKNDYTMQEWYTALFLKNLIYERTNISLPIHLADEATNAPRIRIGSANWILRDDHTFISKVIGDTWHLSANSLFAYNSLKIYLEETLFSPVISELLLDKTHEYIGDGTVAATELITPSGDIRMIFNNLWNDASAQSALRAKMFVELYEAYSPDIICLQECSPGLRNMGIVPGLTALGYGEVPSDSTNTYYNGEKVTRNPVFYNTETLTLLDYGFSQFATMNFGKYPELMGGYTKTELYNTAKNDGSKSVTWGIFKSKKTGDIFLVGSTHLWYKGEAIDDVVRTIQMRELREVLTAAAASYMSEHGLAGTMPIFCGGDYNSRMSRPSYDSMSTGKTPFTNLNDIVDPAHKISINSTHGYPTWNPTFGIWSNVGENSSEYSNAIDHIFCSKETADMITVNHMGMPLEKHFAFMSDHSAIFADITFK